MAGVVADGDVVAALKWRYACKQFDATKKIPGEGYMRGWPDLVKMDPAVKGWANSFCE